MKQKGFMMVLGLELLTDATPNIELGYERMSDERSGENVRRPL
jgi:hypothetical protein